MKTDIHWWQYLAEFFLEWEIFQIKFVEKAKTHILCSVTFFRKSCRLWDNVEKCGRAGQCAGDNITRRMRFACRTTKARIKIHNQNIQYLLFFHCNNGYANAPHCYVKRTLYIVHCTLPDMFFVSIRQELGWNGETVCSVWGTNWMYLVPECTVVATFRLCTSGRTNLCVSRVVTAYDRWGHVVACGGS